MPRTLPHPEHEVLPDHGGIPVPPERGGGDGDYHGWRPHDDNPRTRLKRYRTALAFAVVSITGLFVALSIAYVLRKHAGSFDNTGRWSETWKSPALPRVLWLNTIMLLLSTLTAELSRRRSFQEPDATEEWLGMGEPVRQQTLPWLTLTILLGAGFLTGQYAAWQQLYAAGAYFNTNPGNTFFYGLTGLHALHVICGLMAMAGAWLGAVLHRSLESRQIATDVTVWYWHAMSGLWVYLFVLLLCLG